MSEQPAHPAGVPEWDTADRMRKALRESGITGRQMAAYLGVNEATVSTWINGRIGPSLQTLRLWALRTGVRYEWLTTGGVASQPGDGPDPGPGTFSQVSAGPHHRSCAPRRLTLAVAA